MIIYPADDESLLKESLEFNKKKKLNPPIPTIKPSIEPKLRDPLPISKSLDTSFVNLENASTSPTSPNITSLTDNVQPTVQAGREEYVEQRMKRPGWKQALINAGLGALSGLGSGQGLGGAFGGAVGGLIGGKLGGRERALEAEYNVMQRPRDAQFIQGQQANEDRARQIGFENARTDDLQSQTGYRNIQTQIAPLQYKLEREKYNLDLKRIDAEINNLTFQQGQVKNQFEYSKKQDEINNKLRERETIIKEADVGVGVGGMLPSARMKLDSGDEHALLGQAEGYAYRILTPEKTNSLYQKYYNDAYSQIITPELQARAAKYEPDALEAIKKAQSVAAQSASNILERDNKKWQQLFHDEFRERAKRRLPPPGGGEIDKNRYVQFVKETAKSKKISEEDADSFLRALGYQPSRSWGDMIKDDPNLLNQMFKSKK